MAKTTKLLRQSLNPEHYYEYQPEFGVWSVHFENLTELSIEKVTKIFKKYGSVKNVSQTGSCQGYCFISYWRQEDAKNCVQQISNDGIKLRSFSPKIRLIKDRQLSDDPQMFEAMKRKPIKTLNVSTSSIKTNDTNNNSKGKNDLKKYEKYYEAKSVFFANPKKLSINKIRGIFSKYGYIETIQQTGYPTGWCFVRFGDEKFARECAIDIMSKGIIQLEEFKPAAALRARKYGKKFDESSSNKSVNSDDSMTDNNEEHSGFQNRFGENLGDDFEEIDPIIEEHDEGKNNREEMVKSLEKLFSNIGKFVKKVIMDTGKCFYVPMDSRVPWERLDTVVVENVPAEGIIVANIHQNCRADFWFKLFEKFQPIYISKVKQIEGNYLNYCVIYVKTEALATAAVMHYHNVEVYGKNLIVVKHEASRAGGGN